MNSEEPFKIMIKMTFCTLLSLHVNPPLILYAAALFVPHWHRTFSQVSELMKINRQNKVSNLINMLSKCHN